MSGKLFDRFRKQPPAEFGYLTLAQKERLVNPQSAADKELNSKPQREVIIARLYCVYQCACGPVDFL